MYISDIDISRRATLRTLVYLIISLFCALFGAVYEIFSHEVYSFYMIYAFMFPLIGGVLPFLLFSLFWPRQLPGETAGNLYHSGIATLTVGSIIRGVLDIYGTTNRLTRVYWYLGIALTGAGIISFVIAIKKGVVEESS